MIKKSAKTIFTEVKKLFNIDDIDINKKLVSKRESYGKKKPHLNTLLGMVIIMKLHHYV